MTITAGIDIGTSTIKASLFKVENGEEGWLSRYVMRIRQRDPLELARVAFDAVLEDAKIRAQDVDYVATTGEGESVPFHTGHFYSMTTHARGAIYLDPESRAALDIGALHGRAILIDGRHECRRRHPACKQILLERALTELRVCALQLTGRAGQSA